MQLFYNFILDAPRLETECGTVHHRFTLVHPVGGVTAASLKSSNEAQVSAHLQPHWDHSLPPFQLAKKPIWPHLTSHHIIMQWFLSVHKFRMFLFFLVTVLTCLLEMQDVLIAESEPSDLLDMQAALLRHVLRTAQGYPVFIQQQVASFMPGREVKRSAVWASCQTGWKHTHTPSLSCSVKLNCTTYSQKNHSSSHTCDCGAFKVFAHNIFVHCPNVYKALKTWCGVSINVHTL